MLYVHSSAARRSRHGVILMVVVAMLALFAVIGVSFVLYSDSAARSARIQRETESQDKANIDPELLLSYFLGQLIYDVDDVSGIYSGIRGHSLARNMYGADSIIDNFNNQPVVLQRDNTNAYGGTGRLHYTYDSNSGDVAVFNGLDDFNLVNYTFFPRDAVSPLNIGIRDPERLYREWNPKLAPNAPRLRALDPYPQSTSFRRSNVNYIYPDVNNLFLAMVASEGGSAGDQLRVLMPSFHRHWLVNVDPSNPANDLTGRDSNTNNPLLLGKYKMLRPRAIDQLPSGATLATFTPRFPAPELTTPPGVGTIAIAGDVKNLTGAVGGNDSVWLDLGFPVQTLPNGRKFKPLFAPLIIDLDRCVNLNVHGNLTDRGNNNIVHSSNQGWGPWEVNLQRVLNATDTNGNPLPEWQNLLNGTRNTNQIYEQLQFGRYGSDDLPTANPPRPLPGDRQQSATINGRFYSYNGIDFTAKATGKLYPLAQRGFPDFTASGYYGGGSFTVPSDHPSLYNVFQPGLLSSGARVDDRSFSISNMEALLRLNDTGSSSLSSDLFRLCPQNFSSVGSARIRNNVTTHSYDLDVPALVPYLSGTETPMAMVGTLPTAPPRPAGALNTLPNPLPTSGEFAPAWRAAVARLGKLDLNRPLPGYYPVGTAAGSPLSTTSPQFKAAVKARQLLAEDIFLRLEIAAGTTGWDTATNSFIPQTTASVDVRRWLAQLAVNIVDFLDEDEYATVFHWNSTDTTQIVVGTELPRLVLNEACVEAENDRVAIIGKNPDYTKLTMKVWAELHNPLLSHSSNSFLSDAGDALLDGNHYQLIVCGQDTGGSSSLTPEQHLRVAANSIGTTGAVPNAQGGQGTTPLKVYATVTAFNPGQNKSHVVPGNQPRSYFVVGPMGNFPGPGNSVVVDGQASQLEFATNMNGGIIDPSDLTLVLQRKAIPHLTDGSNDPTSPYYNPHITVDYLRVNQVWDAREYSSDGTPRKVDFGAFRSVGRQQPYVGNFGALTQQPAAQNKPGETFGKDNSPLNSPFNWLVHYDRQLVNVMELLQVSGFKPHELTQVFQLPYNLTGWNIATPPTSTPSPPWPYAHLVPWFDEDQAAASPPQSHRLFRAFDLMTVRSRQTGTGPVRLSVQNMANGNVTLPPGSDQTAVRLVLPQTEGLTPSGTPWKIQKGDVLVLRDASNGFSENCRVLLVSGTAVEIAMEFAAQNQASNYSGMPIVELTSTRERVPGKINLNTLWHGDVWSALCDPQNANLFDQNTVNTLFTEKLFNSDPAKMARSKNGQAPTSTDQPFVNFSVGGYTGSDAVFGAGANSTLARLLDAPNQTTSPYQRNELLAKIINNTTNRSNVFAMWLTVGFFEVVQDEANGVPVLPVILGEELGRSENRHVRRRMFAIIDRTHLYTPTRSVESASLPGVSVQQIGTVSNVNATAATISLAATGGTAVFDLAGAGMPEARFALDWQVHQGLVLQIGPTGGASTEYAAVANFNPTNGTCTVALTNPNHTTNEPVFLRLVQGNPGPQPGFKVKQNTALVPYMSIIQ